MIAKLLVSIVQFDHCAEELGDLRSLEDLLILALILPTGTCDRRRGMCLLTHLALLGEDAMDSASPLSLGESPGINPLPYPPPGVRIPTT